jgi:hypothetical protein
VWASNELGARSILTVDTTSGRVARFEHVNVLILAGKQMCAGQP